MAFDKYSDTIHEANRAYRAFALPNGDTKEIRDRFIASIKALIAYINEDQMPLLAELRTVERSE